jgi:hypothetical protein
VTANAAFAPFSARYGLRSHLRAWGRDHFIARHSGTGYSGWGNCERAEVARCACPGSRSRKRCCDRATQEDFLCDACREHCWASDGNGIKVRLIDVHGSAAGEHDDADGAS